MRVVRFMSEEEYQRYWQGEVLRNGTDQREIWAGSSAKGFCFFEVGPAHDTPEERLHYLSGIASMDRCVIMETDARMTKTVAKYRNPWLDNERCLIDDIPTMERAEYSIEEYSRGKFRPIRVGRPDLWTGTIAWGGEG